MKKKFKPGTIVPVGSGVHALDFALKGLKLISDIDKIMRAGRAARQQQNADPITEDADFEIVAPKQLPNTIDNTNI